MKTLQSRECLESRRYVSEQALRIRASIQSVPILGEGDEQCLRRCSNFRESLLLDQAAQPLYLDL